ncbi:MAG: hypothetical protein ABIW38_08235 [Ferruginibacter sp.]
MKEVFMTVLKWFLNNTFANRHSIFTIYTTTTFNYKVSHSISI